MKTELEEAAEKYLQECRLLTNVHLSNPIHAERCKNNFIAGGNYQAERMYSEEDLRKAYFFGISSTGEGWNGEYAGGNNPNIEEKFSKGFTQWFEQFKKK